MPRYIDWGPETRSLLMTLERYGFKIVSVDNGEYTTQFDKVPRSKFVEECMACDDCHLCVVSPVDNKRKLVYLVYGNSPGELICDYALDEKLDEICEDHYDKWIDKPYTYKNEL